MAFHDAYTEFPQAWAENGFWEAATRNTDSTVAAQSTYADDIPRQRLEDWEEENPEKAEEFEIDPDALTERSWFETTGADGETTTEGVDDEDMPDLSTLRWIVDNIGLIVGGIVLLYALTLLQPILNVVEEVLT